jgi:nucleoside-triphosphatase THEP1
MNVLNCIKLNETFYHFVSGGSGFGKTHLIRAVQHTINRFLDKHHQRVDEIDKNDPMHLILTAFTGKAAFHIRGATLHGAFGLALENKVGDLSEARLKKFRKAFAHLRLIIIDEISLVDSNLFSKVDKRLRQIFKKKKTPFGGISILVVGDFNQKRPVNGSWIFKHNPGNPYANLTNKLWDLFKLLELVEIMRQAGDKRFAEALHRLGNDGLIGLTDADIDLLDSRIITDLSLIPTSAVHLFRTKDDVADFNKEHITNKLGNYILNKAKNEYNGDEHGRREAEKYLKFVENLPEDKAGGLHDELLLKEDCKYMITYNQDVNDGLVNGTCGILKKFVLNDIGDQAVRLYMDFFEEDIGDGARISENKQNRLKLQNNYGITIEKNWVPLELVSRKLRIEKKTWWVKRQQFQLTPAEALTIYKIEGSTCPAIAFDMSQKGLDRSDWYVALSRVECLANLYLYNKRSIVEGKSFLRYSPQKKKRVIKFNKKTNAVQIELRRLRKHAILIDKYPFLMDSSETTDIRRYITIMYHQVDGLVAKLPFIKADYGFMSADILILTRCHTNPMCGIDSELQTCIINGYTLIRLTGSTRTNKSNGIALYIRDKFCDKIKFIKDNSENKLYSTNKNLEIGIFYFKINGDPVYICYLSNHQDNNIASFWHEFKKFIRQISDTAKKGVYPKLFIIGTFNINQSSTEELEIISKIKTKFCLINLINLPSTDLNTSLDWCLTNVINENETLKYETMLYESYFSEHKPIWLKFYLDYY